MGDCRRRGSRLLVVDLESPPVCRGKGTAFLGLSGSVILPFPLSTFFNLTLSVTWACSLREVAPQVLAARGLWSTGSLVIPATGLRTEEASTSYTNSDSLEIEASQSEYMNFLWV